MAYSSRGKSFFMFTPKFPYRCGKDPHIVGGMGEYEIHQSTPEVCVESQISPICPSRTKNSSMVALYAFYWRFAQ